MKIQYKMKGHSFLQERVFSEILFHTFRTRKDAQFLVFYLGIEHMTSHLQYDVNVANTSNAFRGIYVCH